MDDAYLNTLELVNGKLQVNQNAYADLLATQYAEAQMEAISQAISELNAIAKGDAAEKAETFTEATEDEKNKLEALAPALKNATIGTGELAGALLLPDPLKRRQYRRDRSKNLVCYDGFKYQIVFDQH